MKKYTINTSIEKNFPQFLWVIKFVNKAGRTNIAEISRKVEVTYAHTCQILSALEKLDLVESTVKGRVRFVSITEKGKRVGEAYEYLLQQLEGGEIGESNGDEGIQLGNGSPA